MRILAFLSRFPARFLARFMARFLARFLALLLPPLLPLSLLSTTACAAGLTAASPLASTGASPGSATTAQRDPAAMLQRADTNHDGKITHQEFVDARAQLFSRLDRNGDGYLDASDKPQRLLRRNRDNGSDSARGQPLSTLDSNHDGRVSRDEFVNAPTRLFDQADTNHDGVVDSAELQALKQPH